MPLRYLDLLYIGKSDYEAVSVMRNDKYIENSLNITNVLSAERLCRHLDEDAEKFCRALLALPSI